MPMSKEPESLDNINKLLQHSYQELQFYDKQANCNGEKFNIFNVLNVGRKEVQTHSKFIYELLSSKGRHGMDSTFLKHFLTIVLGIYDESQIFNIRRETSIEEGKRIDFTLESADYIIGIEMKIDALDQPNQLYDYNEHLQLASNGTKKVILFYLTLNGSSASHESLKSSKDKLKELDEKEYEKISFSNHVMEWISCCIKESAMKAVLREALIQYHLLLESLTGQRRGFEMILGKQLANNTEDLRAALTIEKSLLKTKILLQEHFWNHLYETLTKQNLNVKIYGGKSITDMVSKYYKNSRNNKNIGLKYFISDYQGKKIWMYINLYNWVHYGLRVEDNDGFILKEKKIKDDIIDIFPMGNAECNDKLDWIVCYYNDLDSSQKQIKFNPDNTPTLLTLSSEQETDELILSLIKHLNFLENRFVFASEKSSYNEGKLLAPIENE